MAPYQFRHLAGFVIVASLLLLCFIFNAQTVHAGLARCRLRNGPIPFDLRCDKYNNEGTAKDLDNQATDQLNTAINLETAELTAARLNNNHGNDNEPTTSRRSFASLFNTMENENDFILDNNNNNNNDLYNPTFDAYCFNEDYPVPSLPSINAQTALFLDYKAVFDAAFDAADIFVSQDRIPGMFLRMCFHDNTINIDDTDMDFRTYVANAIDPATNKWTAESRFMITSGADASNLICPEERTHPNNNLDQTATKVLTRIQRSATLKSKHPDMSYADLLHNGCNAATIYLTNADPTTALSSNPFTFGRKDACHVDVKCGKKYALCGPSELLPGINVNVNDASDWFTLRGMNVCSMMALMWTHTTIEELQFACPIKRLICTATQDDVNNFGSPNRFFNVGDELDYYDFFLNRGTHIPDEGDDCNYSVRGGCSWTVDGNNVPWPMTRVDCTFGLSNVENVTGSSSALTNVIKNFVHNSTHYNRYDLLQCALNQLGGTGIGTMDNANNACAQVLPTECKANSEHMFGSFYSSLPSTTVPRSTVDPSCERYGYRRHRSRHLSDVDSPTEYVRNKHSDCLDVAYDIFLIIDGVHFVMLTTPTADSNAEFCPSLMVHSEYDDLSLEMEKVMIVLPSDVASINDEMTFHLGVRTLDNILETYDTVNVGYTNDKSYTMIYHPITNNCVALLQNMAVSLNIPLRDNSPLQEFITNRMLLSLLSNSNDRYETNALLDRMIQEFKMEEYNGYIHRLLSISSSMTTGTMISKIMGYYML
jgi:Peroxidase